MTSTDGIVIDGRLIKKGDMSGPKSAQMVLQNPTVDTAVFEVARGGILREGLGYDRNDVAVVTNVTGDHLGLGGIDSLGQLANVKGVLVEAVPRSGTAVLNADDPLVARMARHCPGRVVYFSMSTEKGEDGFDRVDGHVGRGGAAFCLEQTPEGELIVLRMAGRQMPLLYTHLIPATFGGRARMNVANALAAAAAAWAAGAHLHDIRQGLRTFSTSFFQAPGRLNLLELDGMRVVIDYCHNVDGMRKLTDFVDRMMVDAPPRDRPGRGLEGVDGVDGAGDGSAAASPPGAGARRGAVARSASSASRATAATTTSASTARSPRRRSTRSSSARTRTCAADSPARRADNVLEGIRRARADGSGRDGARREDPRRAGRRAGGAATRDAGRPRGRCASTTRWRSIARRWRRRGGRASARRSRIRGS